VRKISTKIFQVTLLVGSIIPLFAYANNQDNIDTAYRIKLSPNSTQSQPTYFTCIVTPSEKHPTLQKWTPPLDFTNVCLVNYAQNVQGFNGLGILKTTAGYLNDHYFRAYHDNDFPNSVPGFVDAFVLWAGYKIECRDITNNIKNATYVGTVKLTYNNIKYNLGLAGSNFN